MIFFWLSMPTVAPSQATQGVEGEVPA